MQSTLLSPLYRLLQKGVKFYWSIECQQAFEKSKNILSNKSLLVYYDPNKPLSLSCDASSVGVGAVLSHEVEGKQIPIAFASATLSKAERGYAQVEKEALAIIFGVKRFHKYLFGRQFVLYTDHQALQSIFNPAKGITITASSRLQRWSIILSGYQYKIQYRKGKEMSSPDALSRLPMSDSVTAEISTSLINCVGTENVLTFTFEDVSKHTRSDISVGTENVLTFTFEDVSKHTRSDIILSKVIVLIQSGWPDNLTDPAFKPYFDKRNCLSIEQGCIVWGIRVVVPVALQRYVLQLLHHSHPGIVKMKLLARSTCWWPNIDKDIVNLAENCEQCQHARHANSKEQNYTGWPVTSIPWSRVHADFFYLHSRTVLLIVDSTTKWIELFIMGATTAYDVISRLRGVFSQFGYPRQFVTDNGPPFASREFINFLARHGIEAKKSPPYFPQANGLSERMVQLVKQSLQKMLGKPPYSKERLEEAIEEFLINYRNTPTIITGKCPAEMLLHFKPRTLLNQLQPPFGRESILPSTSNPNYVYPSKIFSEGDMVWLRAKGKWEKSKVRQVLSGSRYLIQNNGHIRVAHRQQLRLAEHFHDWVTSTKPAAGLDPGRQCQDTSVSQLPNTQASRLEEHSEVPGLSSNESNQTENQSSSQAVEVPSPAVEVRRSSRIRHPPSRLEYHRLGNPT